MTETWEREYKGQLHFRLNAGNRQLSLNILPAWKSRTVTWRFVRRVDDRPMRTTEDLPFKILPPSHPASSQPTIEPQRNDDVELSLGGSDALQSCPPYTGRQSAACAYTNLPPSSVCPFAISHAFLQTPLHRFCDRIRRPPMPAGSCLRKH